MEKGWEGRQMARATHTLISGMKDEGPYILEWVAHHLVLGFDRICIASNDCSDGSDALLDALQAAGHIEHLAHVVGPGAIPQHAGYAALRARFSIDDTEWLAVLDADEFLNVHVGSHGVA
ncbi:MAG: glycosyltransferase family 2 protein, partial [Candidatus Saccharibacteria bacterium]|nr:glycosyltransferase family 2 protein [Pseudorhodobacter sp.]